MPPVAADHVFLIEDVKCAVVTKFSVEKATYIAAVQEPLIEHAKFAVEANSNS